MEWSSILVAGAVGAVIQHLFPGVVGLPRYLWRLATRRAHLVGTWYAYHYTREHQRCTLKTSIWQVRQTISGDYVVSGRWGVRGSATTSNAGAPQDLDHDGVPFTGTVVIEMGHVAATLRWGSQKEFVFVRFPNPVQGGIHPVTGLWLGFDYDRELVAGPIVLSGRPLARPRAEHLLRGMSSDSRVHLLAADSPATRARG